MLLRFLKQLFCLHPVWSDKPQWERKEFTRAEFRGGYKDWRTDESWWRCKKCGKVKIFKYRFVPLNWE